MKFYELNAARPCRCRIERTKKDVIPVQDFSRCAICFHQVHSTGHPDREPRPYLCESSLGLEKSWYRTKLVRVYTYVDHVPFCTAQYWRDESCHSETFPLRHLAIITTSSTYCVTFGFCGYLTSRTCREYVLSPLLSLIVRIAVKHC